MLNRLCQTSRCDPVFAEKTIKISDEKTSPSDNRDLYALLMTSFMWSMSSFSLLAHMQTSQNRRKWVQKQKQALALPFRGCLWDHTPPLLSKGQKVWGRKAHLEEPMTRARNIRYHSTAVFSPRASTQNLELLSVHVANSFSFWAPQRGASIHTCRYMYISIERYPFKHINACLTTSMWQIRLWRRLFSQEPIKKWTPLDAWVVRKVI